jgi:nitroreductase
MNVTQAVLHRTSIRAFRPDPVPERTVREILEIASRSPSGGNLQPWRVYAIAGKRLDELRTLIRDRLAKDPDADEHEYDVYPPRLWDPFRRRRFECGEDLYATIGVKREDREGRIAQFARNFDFFGAPVGLFFCLDRKLGPPQWSDLGMFMQTVMLLAVERGLDTCAQEAWSRWARTAAAFLQLPEDHLLFSGMALGFRDPAAPINELRTRREPLGEFAFFSGF